MGNAQGEGARALRALLAAADRMGEVMNGLPALLEDELAISRARLHAIGRLARGATSQGELAEATMTSPSAASRLVTGMEDDGLVRRVPDADDRRVVRVELTDDGRSLARAVRERTTELFAGVVDQVGPARVEQAADALGLLLGALADEVASARGGREARSCLSPDGPSDRTDRPPRG